MEGGLSAFRTETGSETREAGGLRLAILLRMALIVMGMDMHLGRQNRINSSSACEPKSLKRGRGGTDNPDDLKRTGLLRQPQQSATVAVRTVASEELY